MTDTRAPVHPVTLEFLKWVAARTRTYAETMEAWQTSCPRHSAWEDSIADDLVRLQRRDTGAIVVLTDRGKALVWGGER